jgi:hypothetical protein
MPVLPQTLVPLAGCFFSAGARSFDLSELGGGTNAAPLRHVSREADTRGWSFAFSACGDVPLRSVGAACGAVVPSAVLMRTLGECYSLGTFATREVAATASGLNLTFRSGERCTVVEVECAELERPQVVRFGHARSGSACPYAALVRARAGCALECKRNISGAVCSAKCEGPCKEKSENSNTSSVCVSKILMQLLVLLRLKGC